VIVWVADPGPYLVEKHPPPDAEALLWTFSTSVRFVPSKKEKGEKHQRRSRKNFWPEWQLPPSFLLSASAVVLQQNPTAGPVRGGCIRQGRCGDLQTSAFP
jgi:hypothetical protein